tara:strand:- start:252 stop:461 length:210 start_codon:yes stop_codon:yes gene_type:complete
MSKIKKHRDAWKDYWFGRWIDIDIIGEDNYAVQIKREKGLCKKSWEMETKSHSEKYIKSKEDGETPAYE